MSRSNVWRTIIGVLFALSAIGVGVYYVMHRQPGSQIDRGAMITLWSLFYFLCLCVIVLGCAEFAALEGVVYLVILAGEAVLPGLCVHLISQLKGTSCPTAVLEITCHLMLTMMSCLLLAGWGTVLAFQYMGKGAAPWWVRLYVCGAPIIGFSVLLWAILDNENFVNLAVVQQGSLISGVWPSMVDIPMSYARILLTVITMFLPWVKTRMIANATTS